MGVLRANVGGTWVDIGGGAEEVFIGPDDPITAVPSIELWYDSDDTTSLLQTGLSSGLEADKPTAPTVPMTWFSTDTRRKWLWDGTKWLFDGGSVPRMSAQRATGISVAHGAALNIPFSDGKFYDTDNALSADGTTFTCKVAGMYLATYQLWIPAINPAGSFEAIIVRNAVDRFGWHKITIPALTDWDLISAGQMPLAVGDTLVVSCYQTSGQARNVGAAPWSSQFNVAWIGAL